MATENGLQPVLPTMGFIPNKLHRSLKLFNFFPALYILMQQEVTLNEIGSGRTVNKKCSVR
jgi:hypothetical protein